MATPVELVQATLAPAFLVSGTAVFLNFVQNRLFRVVDRLREGEFPGGVRQAYVRRARILRNAIVAGVVAITLTLLTAFGTLLTALFAEPYEWLILVSFGSGMAALVLAASFAVWDTILSVRSAERDARAERA